MKPSPPLPLESQIDPEHFAAIGLVIVQWAATERALLYILPLLVTNDSASWKDIYAPMFVATGMSSRTLLSLIQAAGTERFPDEKSEFVKLIKALEASGKARDFIAHNPWSKAKRSGAIAAVQLKTVGKVSQTRQEHTAHEMREIAVTAHLRLYALIDFLKKRGIWKDIPPTLA